MIRLSTREAAKKLSIITAGEYYAIDVRFQDKTALHFIIEPGFIMETELADSKTGNWRPIKRQPVTACSGNTFPFDSLNLLLSLAARSGLGRRKVGRFGAALRPQFILAADENSQDAKDGQRCDGNRRAYPCTSGHLESKIKEK